MGSTRCIKFTYYIIWNHPHIHGEYRLYPQNKVCCQESSPYTWGVLPVHAVNLKGEGIIPIYMGSTLKKYRYIGILKSQSHRFLLTSLPKIMWPEHQTRHDVGLNFLFDMLLKQSSNDNYLKIPELFLLLA